MDDVAGWIAEHHVAEVECLVPDLNGVLRGKVLPAAKFLKALDGGALYMPTSAALIGVDGRYCGANDEGFAYSDPDMLIVPDVETLRLAPDTQPIRAFVIADAWYPVDRPWGVLPRTLLKSVIALYAEHGWRPVVAPELEFYVAGPNADPREAVAAPLTANGRREHAQRPYDMEALELFDPLTRSIYENCAQAGIELEALSHETGPAQLEVNLLHGDPLDLADQVVLFKRIARKAATAHGMTATFMAKPIENQASSALHLHVSLVGNSGENLFAEPSGDDAERFHHFIGGLQKYLPEMMPLLAPNVNSYRRIRPGLSSPANIEWSHDNRSCGLRVPRAGPEARRVENRLPGADANPYLAIAATLIAGYLGMQERLGRKPEAFGNAYRAKTTLPRTTAHALERFAACEPVRALVGDDFFGIFMRVKQMELDAFDTIVTAWEREHLF